MSNKAQTMLSSKQYFCQKNFISNTQNIISIETVTHVPTRVDNLIKTGVENFSKATKMAEKRDADLFELSVFIESLSCHRSICSTHE